MTDPVKVLSDDEVQHVWANNKIGELVISPEIDALCATVRTLRQQIAELTAEWCQCGHAKSQHGFFSDHDECYECDQMSDDLCCEWRPAPRVTDTYTALREQLAERDARITELERRLRIPFGRLSCALCGGPHDFDTSLPSVIWNRTIRAKGLPDYLCTTCIVREFVRAGESFTAQLWNEEFNGVNIEVVIDGQNAKDAAAIQEENNSLRNQLSRREGGVNDT